MYPLRVREWFYTFNRPPRRSRTITTYEFVSNFTSTFYESGPPWKIYGFDAFNFFTSTFLFKFA